MLHELDVAGLRLARAGSPSAATVRAVARFSSLGEHARIWLALGALGALLDRRRRAQWRAATRRVGLAYVVNTALKLVVRRPRPRDATAPQLTGTPTQLSFPSAHATTGFAAARLYSRLGMPAPALHALAAALAWSRVFLGVHYPSDVIGGALLGRVLGR